MLLYYCHECGQRKASTHFAPNQLERGTRACRACENLRQVKMAVRLDEVMKRCYGCAATKRLGEFPADQRLDKRGLCYDCVYPDPPTPPPADYWERRWERSTPFVEARPDRWAGMDAMNRQAQSTD